MVNLLTDLGKSHSDIRLLYTGPKMHAEAERLSENVKSESRVRGGVGTRIFCICTNSVGPNPGNLCNPLTTGLPTCVH